MGYPYRTLAGDGDDEDEDQDLGPEDRETPEGVEDEAVYGYSPFLVRNIYLKNKPNDRLYVRTRKANMPLIYYIAPF